MKAKNELFKMVKEYKYIKGLQVRFTELKFKLIYALERMDEN